MVTSNAVRLTRYTNYVVSRWRDNTQRNCGVSQAQPVELPGVQSNQRSTVQRIMPAKVGSITRVRRSFGYVQMVSRPWVSRQALATDWL